MGLATLVGVAAVGLFAFNGSSAEAQSFTDFQNFTVGMSVDGQDGWRATNPNWDEEVVDLGGNKAWRVSNDFTSGSFGDQPFAAPSGQYAGESTSTHLFTGNPAVTNRFIASFDFWSVTGAAQTGLDVTVSPDDGQGSRQSFISIEDNGNGIEIDFFDTDGNHPDTNQNGGFRFTPIATGLAYDQVHTVVFDITFVDGNIIDPDGTVHGNDIVRVYVDNALVHTGTTWESYFWTTTEGQTPPSVRAIDTLLFRLSGTAVPSVSGNGYYFDNVEIIRSAFISKEISSGPCASDPEEICEGGSDEFVKIVEGIENGSFEDDGCSVPFDGNKNLSAWSEDAGNVDLICGLWENHDGTRSLDMSGSSRGTISQTIDNLDIGTNYKVGFWMSGNGADACGMAPADKLKELRVSINTAVPTVEDFAFDAGDITDQTTDMMWHMEMLVFEAEATSHTLTFEDISAGSDTRCGVALDDVMLFEEVLGAIAVAVEAPATSSIHYDFKITVDTTDLTDPVVYDTVPAEWTVTHIDGEKVGPDDNHYQFDENFGDEYIGVGCGGLQTDLGDGENVTVSRGGSYKKNKCSSSTHLVWGTPLESDVTDMLRVDLQSRGPKKNGKYKPTFCGALYLNNGAVLMDGSTVIGETGPLVVASMFDLDGGGIDPTGQGDEDGDGLKDIDEVRDLGTNPCNEDTDNDSVPDGADACPLEGPPVGEEINVEGCNVLP